MRTKEEKLDRLLQHIRNQRLKESTEAENLVVLEYILERELSEMWDGYTDPIYKMYLDKLEADGMIKRPDETKWFEFLLKP
jgi:hypothetical protein